MKYNKLTIIKKIQLLFLFIFLSQSYAQNRPTLNDIYSSTRIINRQYEINNSSRAIGINSQFMKSSYGLNWKLINAIDRDSIDFETVYAEPDSFFIINCVTYNSYKNIITNHYQPELITLMDIQKEFCQDVPLRFCLFIIDDLLIYKDPKAHKIDKDYISNIRIFKREDIETLNEKNLDEGNIIRVYTKDSIRLNLIHESNKEFHFLLEN